jgi:threonine synthase
MRYISTRGQSAPVGFSDAVATGLAPDGGLYLPEDLPALGSELTRLAGRPYAEVCFEFLRHFATDIPLGELRAVVDESYRHFDHPDVAPLRRLGPNLQVLELFHGPTLAFKDFALQVLGNLYARQCRVRGETINVLGATSGDTGAAAIHGLLGRTGMAIFILYPDGRVSPLQERQMACTGAANVHALAVDGSFDDAQAIVKALLGDADFRLRHRLSAVNSINLARILAQSVYYLFAWLRLSERERELAEFVVPTGNFGNILAGWMLQKMGVPLRGFRAATNRNDILHRLFTTGEYRLAAVEPSLAPSMDIQVASNFERFLYYGVGRDPAQVRRILREFGEKGSYRFTNFDRDTFASSTCSDAEIPGIIQRVHRDFNYVVDPHTACAFKGIDPARPAVVLATASPAKFPDVIRSAIGFAPTHPLLEALKSAPIARHTIKADAAAIRGFIEARAV